MKKSKIAALTKVILVACGLALLLVLFTPMWRIDLQAPQYPEGLRMLIYADKFAGNVDIINGLNHYIGMKTLHADDFPEFKILPGIIVFFSILFIAIAVIGKRKWLNFLCILFVAFGIIAMVDFWRWEYDYGHNLNPDAAIIVPGMAYQPPLIGFKQLLNFGAWSVPDIGGWIFICVGALLLGSVLAEWNRGRKGKKSITTQSLAMASLILVLTSCNTNPQPIRIGQDICDFCKMPFIDNRFGAELVTKKSKVYKFDDVHCLISFLRSKKIPEAQLAGIYLTDFCMPHELVNVKQAVFLQSPNFKTPMNGNIAAFVSEDSLVSVFSKFNGNKISWEEMQK